MNSFTFHIDELEHASKWLIDISNSKKCFAFHGEMGTGKTTLISAICRQLGVIKSLSSPTFSIINEYVTSSGETIYHIDLYRLKNEQEAIAAGVEDCIYSNKYCFVEWPERAMGLFPEETIHCYLERSGASSRNLQLKS